MTSPLMSSMIESMPTEPERAYLAGIIDGEGCISACQSTGRGFTLYVDVTNTDRRLIDWVAARWPGSTYTTDRSRRGQKDVHRWMAQNAIRVALVLEAALPYLVIKREQAEIALTLAGMRRNPGRAGYTAGERARMRELYDRLRDLNRRGPAWPTRRSA